MEPLQLCLWTVGLLELGVRAGSADFLRKFSALARSASILPETILSGAASRAELRAASALRHRASHL